MNLRLLEDGLLYRMAREVFPAETPWSPPVRMAQVSGLLAVIRASASHGQLRAMLQRQREKARKEGDVAADEAAFYGRLLDDLAVVEEHAEALVRSSAGGLSGKLDAPRRQQVEAYAGRLALAFMQHVAAEYRWRGARR